MRQPDLGIKFTDTNGRDPAEINVGDTGMYLIRQVHNNTWQIHFFPENNKSAVAGKEKEFALLCLAGFDSLIKWWKSNENPDPLNTDFEFVTNRRQLKFIQRNLGSDSVTIFDRSDPHNIEGVLHLLNVMRNPDAMRNIESVSSLLNN